MGYTHVAVGAAGALAVACYTGLPTPETYLVAVTAGAVGGIVPDFDSGGGSDTVTDGLRSRVAAFGTVIVAAALDMAFG